MKSSRIHADLSDITLNALYEDLEEIIRISHQDINEVFSQLLFFLRRKTKRKKFYTLFKNNKQFILHKFLNENNACLCQEQIKESSENAALFKRASVNTLTDDNYHQIELMQNCLKDSILSDFLCCPVLPENLCYRFYCSIKCIEFSEKIKQQLTYKFIELFSKYAHKIWNKSNEKILLYKKLMIHKSSKTEKSANNVLKGWSSEIPWYSESSGLNEWEEIILSSETLPVLSRESLDNVRKQPLLSDNSLHKVKFSSQHNEVYSKSLRLLRRGEKVIIKGENGKELTCQLMSIDDQKGYYSFMNAQGHKVDCISYSVLKERLNNGSIYPVKSYYGIHHYCQNIMLSIMSFLVGILGR
ncbi:hypothetical protein CI610_03014 [invertebrate metagenome]|uniref:Uncharacterized protein n=1 Tax=invertebrate metagenome TaxID=1711999 RepID=A0A2H9T498_9ZZZZ